jgi:SAM-dependent methyltransferase
MDAQAWDERYLQSELIWGVKPNQFLEEEVSDLLPGKALDLACGEGRNALWLAQKGWSVTAVDFSAVALGKARRLAASRGLEVDFVEADVTAWVPPAGSFDLVVVLYLHLPAPSRRQVMARAAQALAHGGVFLVVGHDSDNLCHGHGGPSDPAVLFSSGDIVADLGEVRDAVIRVDKAQQVRRQLWVEPDQPDGEARQVSAIDALVKAVRVG